MALLGNTATEYSCIILVGWTSEIEMQSFKHRNHVLFVEFPYKKDKHFFLLKHVVCTSPDV